MSYFPINRKGEIGELLSVASKALNTARTLAVTLACANENSEEAADDGEFAYRISLAAQLVDESLEYE